MSVSPAQQEDSSTSQIRNARLDRVHFKNAINGIIERVVAHSSKIWNGDDIAGYLEESTRKLLQHNLEGGKMLRGLMVVTTYKSLVPDPTPEDIERVNALGWVIEIIQASSLIADDIMDQSETRRGVPCWYKREDVGMSAVNDSFLVESAANIVLEIYFKDQSCYRELYDLIARVVWLTACGQALDVLTEKDQNSIVEKYSMTRYDMTVKYKTGYYTIFAPVALGMIMAGKSGNAKLMQDVEALTLKIGHYFQVQDDYLDCFGDPEKTGKMGTDIQDNKCSWLFIKAVELANGHELEVLLENYGRHDIECVERVKQIYRNLGVKEKYREYEEEIVEEIKNMALDLGENGENEGMDTSVFMELLERLYNRSE